MKNLSLLILFVLLFDSCFSRSPRKDEFELPIIHNNTTKINKNASQIKNNRYFSFKLKDLYKTSIDKNDYLFFQIESSLSAKNISYILLNEQKEKGNLKNLETNKKKIWYSPKIINKQNFPNKIIYQFAVYAKRNNWVKETIVIRVGPSIQNENLKCDPLYNITNSLKDQLNNIIKNQRNPSMKNHRHDIKQKYTKWEKQEHNWKHHGHDKYNKSHKYNEYDKHYKKYDYYRSNEGIIIPAIFLITIWSILLVLYCLVNRRKKHFVAELKNPQQISLVEYHNV